LSASRRLAAAAIVVLAAGCSPEVPPPGPDVAARIGGVDVPLADFVDHLETNLGEDGGALESEALSALFDRFLDERLLSRLAEDRRLVAGSPPADVAVDALLEADPAPPLTETAIVSYFAEHVAEFRLPERVELAIVRTGDRATAERARRELRRGAQFAEIARRYSTDPSAEKGGALGPLARDEMPEGLAEAAFDLAPGRVSEIVAADDGFYLARVERRHPERVPGLGEVRDEILRRIGGARADRAYARFLEEARSRYAVEVFDRNLSFVYRGSYPVSRPYETR